MLRSMSPQTDKLIEDAIRLSEADRIRLAERLLATLDGEPDAGAADAWVEEIERRTREIEQGLVKPLPWSEVRAAMSRKVRDRR